MHFSTQGVGFVDSAYLMGFHISAIWENLYQACMFSQQFILDIVRMGYCHTHNGKHFVKVAPIWFIVAVLRLASRYVMGLSMQEINPGFLDLNWKAFWGVSQNKSTNVSSGSLRYLDIVNHGSPCYMGWPWHEMLLETKAISKTCMILWYYLFVIHFHCCKGGFVQCQGRLLSSILPKLMVCFRNIPDPANPINSTRNCKLQQESSIYILISWPKVCWTLPTLVKLGRESPTVTNYVPV